MGAKVGTVSLSGISVEAKLFSLAKLAAQLTDG